MKPDFRTTLLTLLLLPNITGCAASSAVKAPAETEFKHKLEVSGGFEYRKFGKSPELEKYMDGDGGQRVVLEKSMPGVTEVMQVGDQLPVLNLKLGYSPDIHLLNRDSLTLLLEGGFSSSFIFGGTENSRTLDANVLGYFKFGDTPTEFSQYLNHYGALALGFQYAPAAFGSGMFQVRPVVAFVGGLSHVNSDSVFHFRVTDSSLFEQYGYPLMSSLDISQDSRTEANSSGWGRFAHARAGVRVGYDNLFFVFGGDYNWEKFPELKIRQHLVKDGHIPSDTEVFDSGTTLEYNLTGWGVFLDMGYQLNL